MAIKLFAMDVDGTMTDGKIYIGQNGEIMKAFHVKDGQGLSLLRKNGVKTAIITARRSEIVERRAEELGIDAVCQGVGDKAAVLEDLCRQYHILPQECAYIGDDLGDLPAMEVAGVSMCPADAVPQVKLAADMSLPSKGGEGAIRDAAEWILGQM
ncbi:HAD-IIIA family hydrolase [Pseudoflavonifractor capillosus]|uniref:KdsC family phosphatase n=1 Tax=Pseudoflavonifractor capillosus TaxID=106588 RepID=UPI001D9E49BE|nr:HAD-IIIA family hydrolase [Pseudoflavonifractor capillosus]MBM6896587.1 HAD-IIIA family hydrolase [Pseudoflavonifractor capillosus]